MTVDEDSISTALQNADVVDQLGLGRAFFDAHVDTELASELTKMPVAALDEQLRQGKNLDADLFMTEACLPSVAMGLDSLARHMAKLSESKDVTDYQQMRARFHPLKFLAQHLVRNNPTHQPLTPRRSEMYKKFHSWVDDEKGKRDLIRNKGAIRKAFASYLKDRVLHIKNVDKVLSEIDEIFCLQGILHEQMKKQFDADRATALQHAAQRGETDVDGSASHALAHNDTTQALSTQATQAKPAGGSRKSQRSMTRQMANQDYTRSFAKGTISFDQFWMWFCKCVLEGHGVTASVLRDGAVRKERAQQRAEELALRKQDEDSKNADKEKMRQAFITTREKVKQDEWLGKILEDEEYFLDMFVDDRNAKPVPPEGCHITLLLELLAHYDIVVSEEGAEAEAPTRWNTACWQVWMFIQRVTAMKGLEGQELEPDGCVDTFTLGRLVNVEAADFLRFKKELAHKFQVWRVQGNAAEHEEEASHSSDEEDDEDGKPSFKTLCAELNLPLARLAFFHECFQDEFGEDEEGNLIVDNYPDDPIGLDRPGMKILMRRLLPEMLEDEEFNLRFDEIDTDGGGMIEFDEFIRWLCSCNLTHQFDDTEETERKKSFEELSELFNVAYETIHAKHEEFKAKLGEDDNYPIAGHDPDMGPETWVQPKALSRDQIRDLVSVSGGQEEEFNSQFATLDVNGNGTMEFDEYLELLLACNALGDEIE